MTDFPTGSMPQRGEPGYPAKARGFIETTRDAASEDRAEIRAARDGHTSLSAKLAELEDVDKTLDSRLADVDDELSSRLGSVEAFLESASDFNQDNPVDVKDTILSRVNKIVTSSTDIVDLFIYDTSKDYRGGEWREQCQHTSWYNEPMNTATRGKTQEFPALALIVAESDTVTIYDMTDDTVPMWMVFYAGVGNFINGTGARTSVCASESTIAVTSALDGVSLISFAADKTNVYNAAGFYESIGNIAQRNDALGFNKVSTQGTVDSATNHAAIAVLDNAPIDPTTGLPVLTIAVATDGGVSVIKDDGTVVDWYGSTWDYAYLVDFNYQNQLVIISGDSASADARRYSVVDIPTTDVTNSASVFDLTGYTTPALTNAPSGLDTFEMQKITAGTMAFGVKTGALTYLKEDQSTPTSGMVAYVTNSYNSGWLPGDIRGSWLADTTAEVITGSGEKVINGNFDTDITGWTDASTGAGASIAHDATNLRLSLTSDAVDTAKAQQVITTTVGEHCLLAVDVYDYAVTLNIGTTAGGSEIKTVSLAVGRNFISFDATDVATYLSFEYLDASGAPPTTAGIDNITCKLADHDRSVKNTGLHVVGSLTKAPAATGSELVAYSGFSDLNYLEQPYNPDLDFGTGDFCVMGWLKMAALNPINTIINRDGDGRLFVGIYDDSTLRLYTERGGVVTDALTGAIIDAGIWYNICCVRTSGVLKIFINGSEVNVTRTDNGIIDISATAPTTFFIDAANNELNGYAALIRLSAYAPSADQIKHIYETEKYLFQENAACTLGGTSNAIKALTYDEDTDRLFAGTADGTSIFSGLRRVDHIDSTGTPTSDSIVALSAVNGSYAIATAAEVVAYVPAQSLREELARGDEQQAAFGVALEGFWFTGDATGGVTDFTLEPGWKPQFVYNAGALVKEGAADQYTVTYDGFRHTVSFAVAPADGNDICIMARRV